MKGVSEQLDLQWSPRLGEAERNEARNSLRHVERYGLFDQTC
jgi:hypothetical protein